MIDPQQLQLLARFMEHYHTLLQTAQEANLDPAMRQELQSLQTFLRDTHAQFQDEAKKFNSTVEAEMQQLQQRRDEAEKKIAEAAALRQKQLEELAARRVNYRQIDPLLMEKLRSDLLKDFGNRNHQRAKAARETPEGFKEVWQDWPTTAPSSQPAAASTEQALPDGVRPFAQLIDPQLGEELRQQLLAESESMPAPLQSAQPAKDVWQDWPAR